MRKLLPLFAIATCAFVLLGANAPKADSFGTASISGTITDSTTGDPIAGAVVSAGRCGRSATTAEDGSYTIANLPAGDYTVKAWKCHAYVAKTYPSTVHVEEGQAVTGIDIALAPMGGGGGSGSISGTVYDDVTNEPIAGAKVTAGGCSRYDLTAEDGTYTIANLADGSYTVKAMKCGYHCATYPDPVVVANGQPVTGIDFRLEPNNTTLSD